MSKLLDAAEIRGWLNGAKGERGEVQKASKLVLVAPFITGAGVRALRGTLGVHNRRVELDIVTSLDMDAIAAGYLDLTALIGLLRDTPGDSKVRLWDHQKLHAKVFLSKRSDETQSWHSVVGSANLTGTPAFELAVEQSGEDARAVFERVDAMRRDECTPRDERYLKQVLDRLEEYRELAQQDAGVRFTVLEKFPSDEDSKGGGSHVPRYYDNLKELLQVQLKGRMAWKTARDRLVLAGSEQDSKTAAKRLFFMMNLGLIRIDSATLQVTRTKAGASLARSPAPVQAAFLSSFFGTVPDADRIAAQVYRYRKATEFTYKDFFKKLGRKWVAEDCDEKLILRWMASLRLLDYLPGKSTRFRRAEGNWPKSVRDATRRWRTT